MSNYHPTTASNRLRTSRASPPPRETLRRAAEQILLIALPLFLTAFELSVVLGRHTFGLDFRGVYWLAGHRVLSGASPYNLPMLTAFKYPAPAALLFAPFALLPNAVAGWLFAALVFAAIPATLFLMGVRDWRIYAIVLLWEPVLTGWETGNVSLLLVAGTAAAWRWRDRPAAAGLLVALLVSVKIFLFPLVIWLAATRRWRACAWTVAGTVAANLFAWLVVGWGQIPVYLQLLRNFQPGAERRGYSVIGLALHLGAGRTAAYAVGLAAAAAVIVLALRTRGQERDPLLITACLVASLLASPLVESHYLALLLVPLALRRPRLTALWALPIVLIIAPADHPSNWQHALGVLISLAVPAAAFWPWSKPVARPRYLAERTPARSRT